MVAKNVAPKKKAAGKQHSKKPVQKKIQKKDNTKKEPSGAVDKDFEVDEMERRTGSVDFYDKKRGFGFIKLDQEGVVPENKVMVHWGEISSDDRWPFLTKELKVEFQLKKIAKKGVTTVQAKEVTKVGGDKFALQEELDSKKEFVGDRNMRFLGNVKFYDSQKGFGYVKLQEGYAIDTDVPQEFRVDRHEIVVPEDETPRLAPDMEIEFGIQKNGKGVYACYNVTLPGGDDVTRSIVEGRKDATKATFDGTIQFYSHKSGMGFVEPENASTLPKEFQEALKADAEKRNKKAEKNKKSTTEKPAVYFARQDRASQADRLNKGDKVSFKLYLDNKGIGACEITKKE